MNSTNPLSDQQRQSRIRWVLGIFMAGLVFSGATAIPLATELDWLTTWIGSSGSPLANWLGAIRDALQTTNTHYPFMAYGTDWLAFAHFVIALVFIGAWRDPVRNRWLFDFGLISCALVIPYAMILGEVRGIPLFWRLIDCSFGLGGAVPLWLCRRWALELERRGVDARKPSGVR